MSEAEKFTMPSGAVVYYFDANHSYCTKPPHEHTTGRCHNRCPGKVAGASSIAKNDGSSADGLTRWYEKKACDGVAALDMINGGDQSWLTTGETVLAELEKHHLTAGADMRAKGDAGTAAHNVLEYLAEHDSVPPFSGGHEMAVISWWKSRRPDPIYTEAVVYDDEHGFAGRFDLMFHEGPTLLDLKTGSVRAAAVIQLNLYLVGCRVAGLTVPRRLVVLDTQPDGSWQEIEVPINPRWAMAALDVHTNGKAINRALTVAKKTSRKGKADSSRCPKCEGLPTERGPAWDYNPDVDPPPPICTDPFHDQSRGAGADATRETDKP